MLQGQNFLAVRVDASPRVGMGHFMRCYALAQTWIEMGGRVVFVMSADSPATGRYRSLPGVETRVLTAAAGSLEEARETAAVAKQYQARWIVADSYEFAPGYQAALGSLGQQVLIIDDDARYQRYESDLILNQNVYASGKMYPERGEFTRVLAGPRFALLRDQFVERPSPSRAVPDLGEKVLVTLGGSDPDNATQTVMEALRLAPAGTLQVTVVIGGSNPHREKLERLGAGFPQEIRFVHDAQNMPELMEWADLAVSAAGSTSLELAYLRVPMLLLVLADNQQAVAAGMESRGAARNLGWARDTSPAELAQAIQKLAASQKERQHLSDVAGGLVDGKGAQRVVQLLMDPPMRLRSITREDRQLLFDWANDPVVRAVSFQSAPITWPDHERWFDSILANPNVHAFIAEDSDRDPMGVARFVTTGTEATISLSISSAFRGQGKGRQLIDLATSHILSDLEVTEVRALVKPGNVASVRAFLAAGYRQSSDLDGAHVFIRTR